MHYWATSRGFSRNYTHLWHSFVVCNLLMERLIPVQFVKIIKTFFFCYCIISYYPKQSYKFEYCQLSRTSRGSFTTARKPHSVKYWSMTEPVESNMSIVFASIFLNQTNLYKFNKNCSFAAANKSLYFNSIYYCTLIAVCRKKNWLKSSRKKVWSWNAHVLASKRQFSWWQMSFKIQFYDI